MHRLGFTLPPITYLRQCPYVAAAGSCLATSPLGDGAWVYGLMIAPMGDANKAYFYRYAVGRDGTPVSDSWQLLPTPAWVATETIDSGTCMIVDPTDGRVWLITADNAAGPIYHRWRVFNAATLAWANLAEATGTLEVALPAIAAAITNASLAHPCTAVSSAVVTDDFIYLSIGNVANLARYSKGGDGWAAMGARAGVPGAGSSLDFMASRPDNLYGLRGGGVSNLDTYTITTNAFATSVALPGAETFGAGTEVTTNPRFPDRLIVHRNDTIYRMDRTAAIQPIASVAGSDGAQHSGHGVVSYNVGQKAFVALRLHSKTDFERIEIVE